MTSTDQIEQGIIAALVVSSYVVNMLQAKSAAKSVANKVEVTAAEQKAKIEEVHGIVNSTSQVQLEKIAGLEAALKEAQNK